MKMMDYPEFPDSSNRKFTLDYTKHEAFVFADERNCTTHVFVYPESETSDITEVFLPPSPIIDAKEDRSLKQFTSDN